MSEYKIPTEIIDIVYGLLGSETVAKYKIKHPDWTAEGIDKPDEYIVVNALPTTFDVMQKCYVNVNYHVADLGAGMPNHPALTTAGQRIMTLLQKVSTTSYLIDVEPSGEIFEEKDEHFVNVRISVKYINS